MGSQNPSLEFDEEMRSQRVHLSLLPLATLVSPLLSQLKFSGGVSSSSNSNSPSSGNRNTNSRPTDVDEKFFFGGFNNQNQGFNNQNNRGCQCDYSLTFR